ncbi:MAG: redoxin family protein [Cyanobacteria bacterium]|jgi:peroxiredoxin|nr:redoxin family protein [Cyanobacteria bacterium GSL.Bin21]
MTDLEQLPNDIPIPKDDGGCDHLVGLEMPNVTLPATNGVEVSRFESGLTVLYAYPMTGQPGQALPEGWDSIPGARGCTPQACTMRDHYAELQAFGAQVYGLSTQETTYQAEMVERLHLPFPVLSDAKLELTRALNLPTIEVEGMILIKRLTLIIENNRIQYVFYPVFPPDQHADQILNWLKTQSQK